MKLFALLVVGVVVGWAASGVDWSREAVGQDALTDVPPSTTLPTLPDAPPQPTYRAVPDEPGRVANSLKADATLDPSIPRPRRVWETRVTTDSNGARHTEVMSRLVNADGSIVPEMPPETPPGLVGRFQASAYGSPSGHGCYVVDTMTGKTWHVANGQPARVVAEGFVPQATPTQSTWLPPDHQSPLGSVVVPTPSNSERSLFRESAPVPQSKSVVEPTPKQNPEPSDAD